MLGLLPNVPLDLAQLAALLTDKDDLFLVWPEANFPFDQEQWREKLLSRPGNRSYFVALDGQIIGHAALIETDEPEVRVLSYVFIHPNQRGRGFGRELVPLMEVESPGRRACLPDRARAATSLEFQMIDISSEARAIRLAQL
jgi:[ribosomal protein S18]-alanine N-acetyltransferase